MELKLIYDVCIIGSGAGAGPIAYTLAKEGKKVLILEKGDIYNDRCEASRCISRIYDK